MEKFFNRLMSVIAFGALMYLAYIDKQLHRAVYSILAGVIFQASKDDIIKIITLLKNKKDE